MKIVHLSTFYSGGAGHAAFLLHKALHNAGEESSMIFVQSLDNYRDLPDCYSISNQSLSLRFKNGLKNLKGKATLEKEFQLVKNKIVAENVSLPFAHYDVLNHPAVNKADIIHLHWVAGMIDYKSFFRNTKKNIVWTFHDMNPFNGIFFYKEDEIENQDVTDNLNNEVKLFKRSCFLSFTQNMHITTPSYWMEKEAILSGQFEKCSSSVIPYIVDLNNFKPLNKTALRKEFGILADTKVLLFAAMSINNTRKGFDLLKEALTLLSFSNHDVLLIALGENKFSNDISLPVRFAGQIKNETLLCKYYNVADAFILPSREDNLPNVMLEAFACGIPVIGFPVGGIKEHILDGETGYVAEEISSYALKDVLEKFFINSKCFNAASIRQYAEDNFSSKKIVKRFMEIYTRLAVA